MQHIISSVRAALASENWYAALAVALTLPDACMQCEGGLSHAEGFRTFFERYMKQHYVKLMKPDIDPAHYGLGDQLASAEGTDVPDIYEDLERRMRAYGNAIFNAPDEPFEFMNGDDLYGFRCALLHEGQANIDRKGHRGKNRVLSKFELVAPRNNNHIHCNGGGEGMPLQIQVDIFCCQIIEGAEEWLATVGRRPEVAAIVAERAVQIAFA